MPSSSAEPTPQELWLRERRDTALARFDDRIPALYRQHIDLPDIATQWAAGHGPASLFLTGPIGVGKTHAAWQAARAWLSHHYQGAHRGSPTISAYRSTSLFDDLRPGPDGDGQGPRAFARQLQDVDLLFIDDLAAARVSPTGWTQERLYEIFDERYINRRPVLITCDVLPGQISGVVGERVASRLAEMCSGGVHLMRGQDRRQGGAA